MRSLPMKFNSGYMQSHTSHSDHPGQLHTVREVPLSVPASL